MTDSREKKSNETISGKTIPASVKTIQASMKTLPERLSSQELFRHGNTVCIEHDEQIYWLRLTRGNKLILTK